MQVSDDLRKCVLFIGFLNSSDDFVAAGTAFLLQSNSCLYLVTNMHIASSLDDSPFFIRVNRTEGGSAVFRIDPIEVNLKWYSHLTDPDVDIAIMPFNIDFEKSGFEVIVADER